MKALLLLALVAPTAAAMDLLPSEVRLEATEARILVRSAEGSVRVDAAPSVLAAASAPEGEPGAFAPTPRVLAANATWRGLDGILVVVLRRSDPTQTVDVTIEDGSRTGVSLEWPPAPRETPQRGWAAAGALALAFMIRRRGLSRSFSP